MGDSQISSSSPVPFARGVTVMPEWFAYEGIDFVLDRIEALGATAIATSPYVLERCADGAGAREPPPDGDAGKVRPLDRDLFGARELFVRTAPAFAHDFARYRGLRYQPSAPSSLTHANADLLDRVCDAAARRGIRVYFQVMAASPPGYRVQFSGAHADDRCLLPDGRPHDARVDRNASLASAHVVAYTAALVAEIAARYPMAAGIRLDWPEYPPYDLRSALFDFNPSMTARIERSGVDPRELAREAVAWADRVRTAARNAAASGPMATLRALEAGVADAVGIKLYTMHWPMIARYWARDLLGAGAAASEDAATAAIAYRFGLTDDLDDGSALRYPEPDVPHPAGHLAQPAKLATARTIAGSVAVVAFVHSYGPVADVVRRRDIARASGLPVWINRYGYLSDAKIRALAA
jgi:hypothetical protein